MFPWTSDKTTTENWLGPNSQRTERCLWVAQRWKMASVWKYPCLKRGDNNGWFDKHGKKKKHGIWRVPIFLTSALFRVFVPSIWVECIASLAVMASDCFRPYQLPTISFLPLLVGWWTQRYPLLSLSLCDDKRFAKKKCFSFAQRTWERIQTIVFPTWLIRWTSIDTSWISCLYTKRIPGMIDP